MLPQSPSRATPSALPPTHPIRVMMEEHDVILRVLDDLERFTLAAKQAGRTPAHPGELATLRALAEALLAAEPHHRREEEALFPRLEDAGLEGPPQVMRMEHVDLRRAKHELAALAAGGGGDAFREQLVITAGFLVPELRAHIGKENEIVYPMALELLDLEAWRDIERECDRIGPCAFGRR